MSHQLEGRVITGVKIADDRKAILFQTADGDVIARADGDCCSDTWIEHVELPALGFPAIVSQVRDLDMPSSGSDELALYGCGITTDRGEITIDFRNESNGYYGGSLRWPGDHHCGGVYGQNNSTEVWVDLEP